MLENEPQKGIIHTYLLGKSKATASFYHRATVRLMFISIVQEIMCCQQKLRFYFAACFLFSVFPTKRLSQMCCIRSESASEVLLHRVEADF